MKKRNVTPLFTPPLASEITPPEVFANRRKLLRLLAAGAATPALAQWAMRDAHASMVPPPNRRQMLNAIPSSMAGANLDEAITPYDDATTYNNFYEFGLDKGDPAKNADAMPISPWSINIEGLVHKPGVWSLEDLLGLSAMEERIYRLRCVEAWSMVIPWIGYSLAELIKQVEPMGSANYVEFVTLADPQSMPGLRRGVLDWPYTEGLRMDEAMHPLTMLTFGMYGEVLPNQNGAPVRVVVPWKYGFKSAKSIVSIRFVEEMPATAWNKAARHEYGFYSNVNPDVPHRRWSQSSERVIGQSGLFGPKRKTELFNGYAEQVGQLYAGMDLARNF